MTILSHKGLQGSVKFEDGRLLVQILHIDDFITAESDSASTVVEVFRDLVDDYLATCKALGREACKPFKGSLNVRITPELHKRAAMAAAGNDETLNAWIGQAIADKLDKDSDRAQVAAEAIFVKALASSDRSEQNIYKTYSETLPRAFERRSGSDTGEFAKTRNKMQDVARQSLGRVGSH